MVVYAAEGDNVKITVDGVAPDGKPLHTEWMGKFDGKDYPAIGDSNIDARAYTKVDDHTLKGTHKKGGKTIAESQIVVAADGKSRTVTATRTNAMGKKMTSIAVYDKQ